MFEIPLDRPPRSAAQGSMAGPCPDLSGTFDVVGESRPTTELVWLLPFRWERVDSEPPRLDEDLGLLVDPSNGRALPVQGVRAIAFSYPEPNRLRVEPIDEQSGATASPSMGVTFVRVGAGAGQMLQDRARAYRCQEGALEIDWYGGGLMFRNQDVVLYRLADGSLAVEVVTWDGLPLLYYAWRSHSHRYRLWEPAGPGPADEGEPPLPATPRRLPDPG